jgi:hypothetical protein
MSSVRLVSVTGSVATLPFVTTTVKVTLSPGATTPVGSAVLSTLMTGATFVTVTVSSSVSDAELPSLSETVTDAVLE